jgi:hypothetical protein
MILTNIQYSSGTEVTQKLQKIFTLSLTFTHGKISILSCPVCVFL